MRFTAAAMIPTGDFLAHVGDWTGLPPAELLGLMRGSAPVSAGGSERARAADHRDRAGPRRSESCSSPTTTPARCSPRCAPLGGEAGSAVSGYLDLVGYRPLDGFDISEPSALELPDALLRAIRVAVSGQGPRGRRDVDDRIADVRSKVPEEHRSRVRRAARGGPADLPAPRRARRLQRHLGVGTDATGRARGRAPAREQGPHPATPTHLIDAGFDEMCSLLTDSAGPSADELAARADYRGGAQRQGRAGRSWATPPLRRRTPPGCRPAVGTADARHRHRDGLGVRELRAAARSRSPPRAGGEPGRLRGAGPPRLRSIGVRPDRPGRRPRHRRRRPRRSTSCCRCSGRS